jgi:hypothetical protein
MWVKSDRELIVDVDVVALEWVLGENRPGRAGGYALATES